MVRECGQPDGGERGGSGQGVAAASYLFRGGAAKARRCSGGGGEGAWASCPAPREMEGGGGAAEAEDRLVGTGWVGWFSRSAAHHQPKLHLLDGLGWPAVSAPLPAQLFPASRAGSIHLPSPKKKKEHTSYKGNFAKRKILVQKKENYKHALVRSFQLFRSGFSSKRKLSVSG